MSASYVQWAGPSSSFTDGHNCSTQFWTGYDYCVGIVNGTTTTRTSSPASTSSATQSTTYLPYPTQSGIVSNCNKFVEAVSGDYCSIFASNNGITTAQLYAWHPILGSTGQNCDSAFFAGHEYCIGIVSSSTSASLTTTSTTTSTIPKQSGIAANCDKFAEAVSGDYCIKFASDSGITTAELYAWNPVLDGLWVLCRRLFIRSDGGKR